MKVRTAELTGPALDWAVAKCEGKVEAGVYGVPEVVEGELHLHYCDTVLSDRFAPTKCWAQGGPIIEREKIGTDFLVHGFRGPVWYARIGGGDCMYGPAPLIAAMRCYVTGKLGDEVDVPEELLCPSPPTSSAS